MGRCVHGSYLTEVLELVQLPQRITLQPLKVCRGWDNLVGPFQNYQKTTFGKWESITHQNMLIYKNTRIPLQSSS